MFQHLIVPVDGSTAAWSAVPIAARMAAAVDGKLELVTVIDRLGDITPARRDLRAGVDRLDPLEVEPTVEILASDCTAGAIGRHAETIDGSMVMMSSHGHGRSAAVLGSVADDLLRATFGPIIVIGPNAAAASGQLDGNYVVPLDGSKASERILPIVESWSVEFGGTPWIVEVLDPAALVSVGGGSDVMESAYTTRVADRASREIRREVEYEVLHGERPSRSIVDFADRLGASLIFATTHGRSGLARLRVGSVTAEVVRHASCPVVLHRPPHLPA